MTGVRGWGIEDRDALSNSHRNLTLNVQPLKFFQKWAIGCVLLGLVGCQSQPPAGIEAKVERVVSGQTVEVLIPGQPETVERVRLIGVSAPDLQQYPWGVAAKEKLEELLSEKGLQSVVLESEAREKDRFGRRLAYVWLDGVLINEKLIAQGYALADVDWPNDYSQRLIRAQEAARLMGYGIWNPEQPMRLTPEEFRSNRDRNASNP